MNCEEFWKRYDESGLSDELTAHLDGCESCSREVGFERDLMNRVRTLPVYEAPETAWENISREIGVERPESGRRHMGGESRGRPLFGFFRLPEVIPFRAAVAAAACIVLISIAMTYYATNMFLAPDMVAEQERAVEEIELAERDYLAAIAKLDGIVERGKESMDPDLYAAYREKLALLDEYIAECREAVDINNYNPNAHMYLELAYREKVDTLKEMAEHMRNFHN